MDFDEQLDDEEAVDQVKQIIDCLISALNFAEDMMDDYQVAKINAKVGKIYYKHLYKDSEEQKLRILLRAQMHYKLALQLW